MADECNIKHSTKTEQILFPTTNSKSQADFVLFNPNFSSNDAGKTYVYDVTVVHPASISYLAPSNNNSNYCFSFKRTEKTKNI